MNIQAIGLIETKGLIAAIVGADAMTKSANVEIVGNKYYKVKSGIVTVIVTGDVGAVKAAVEVGAEAAKKAGTLITSHAIARPDEFVMKMILPKVYEEVKEDLKKKDKQEVKEKTSQIENNKKDKKEDKLEKEHKVVELVEVKNEQVKVDEIVVTSKDEKEVIMDKSQDIEANKNEKKSSKKEKNNKKK